MITLPTFPDTMPTVFPHHRPFTMDIWGKDWWEFHGYQVELLKGRPLADTPKSWKEIGHISGPASRYDTMRLYRTHDTRKGSSPFRWAQYRDGCFYAFHGKVNILWHDEKLGHEVTWEQWQLILDDPRPMPPEVRKFPHRAYDFLNLFSNVQT